MLTRARAPLKTPPVPLTPPCRELGTAVQRTVALQAESGFCKQSVIGIQPCRFVYVSSKPAIAMWRRRGRLTRKAETGHHAGKSPPESLCHLSEAVDKPFKRSEPLHLHLLRVAPSEGWLLSVHCHIRKRSLTSVTVAKGPLPFFRCQFLVWW